ncbi:hypothetical protein G6F56_012031 [Rhizopus delemar]|nr:hypothetical protein G6F56_012031 [Rhizopus delemar]
MHSQFAGIQGGIFIVSVLLCFLLLVYYAYHQHAERRRRLGWRTITVSILLTLLALVFAIATFVVQIYVRNLIDGALDDLTSSFLGSLFSEFVNIIVSTGTSVWLSLVSLILLFFTLVLLCISMCCINRRRRRRTESNGYDMRST